VKISVSEKRFKNFEKKSMQAAESVVPKRLRDHAATVLFGGFYLTFYTPLAMFVWSEPLFGRNPGPAPVVAALALAGITFVMLALGARLAGPRNTAVRDVSSAILRESLGNFEKTQLDYWRFYTTPEWRAVRLAVIERDGPICRWCTQLASLTDLTVDHVKPRSLFPELALDLGNLQVLCRSCNSKKGARTYQKAQR
jgi:hypothetical protein